jgi:hypothetical protein
MGLRQTAKWRGPGPWLSEAFTPVDELNGGKGGLRVQAILKEVR